jgi:hypothetical protein
MLLDFNRRLQHEYKANDTTCPRTIGNMTVNTGCGGGTVLSCGSVVVQQRILSKWELNS